MSETANYLSCGDFRPGQGRDRIRPKMKMRPAMFAVLLIAALVPRVKRAVQALDIAACLQLIEDIKPLDSAAAILAKCEQVARAHYPELL